MTISGLRKASWYNPSTGTVAQADIISEEGEFYTGPLDTDDRTPVGEQPYGGDESHCELMVYDMDVIEQLKAWERSETRINMVAAGVQENIQWYTPTLVRVEKSYGFNVGGRNSALVTMHREGGRHTIRSQVNLLSHIGWKDDFGNNFPDGYESSGALQNELFENGTFSFETEMNAGIINEEGIAFPIVGIPLTFSMGVVSTNATMRASISFSQWDAQVSSTRGATVTGTGRKSVSTEERDQFFFIERLSFERYETSGTASIEVENPALRVDKSALYSSY